MWATRRLAAAAAVAVAVFAQMTMSAAGSAAQPTPPETPPSETASPTPTPTTPPPTSAPPSPPVPSPPAPPPAPDDPPPPPETPDADAALEQHAHDVMSSHSMAVAEAEALLERALADLQTAQAAVATAVAEAEAARKAAAAAQHAVEVAAQAEERARRELPEIQRQLADAHDDLGAVARDAYQGGGLAPLSVVLDSDTPAEYAESYVGMRALLRAGDSALGQLAVDRADLVNAHARLRAVREQKEAMAEQAAQALTAKETVTASAAAAQRELTEAAEVRVEALQAAEEARLVDYERYQEFLAESEALRPVIIDLSALLARTSATLFGTGTFLRPGTGTVTSAFGIRRHPITGVVKLHTGVDLGRGDGYVYAADTGTVVKAEWNRAYGYMSVIDHGHGVTTVYAHQAQMFVRPGHQVSQGTRIGLVGSTGYSTGPHLHFEVRQDGEPVDPWPLIVDAPLPRPVP
ncbi:MAG: M23 family metallopeptidase [Jiangellaceae bacterium]